MRLVIYAIATSAAVSLMTNVVTAAAFHTLEIRDGWVICKSTVDVPAVGVKTVAWSANYTRREAKKGV